MLSGHPKVRQAPGVVAIARDLDGEEAVQESQTSTAASAQSRMLVSILVLALVLRLAAAILLPDQHFPDAAEYRALAVEIRQFHFSDPYVMPLYPLILALTGTGWGQMGFDIALSVGIVYLVYALTLALSANRVGALLAGLAAAIYPYFIFYAVVGLTETLFIFLLLAGYLAWYRGRFALAAVFVVLSILTRPTIDLLPPLLIPYFAIIIHGKPWGFAVRQLGVYALIYCAVLSPWWVHNYQAYGSFVRLNLGGGQALYSGNNPQNNTGGVSDVMLDMSRFDKIADPVARDRAARDAALAYIAGDPVHFLKMAGLKFSRLWHLWPAAADYATPLYVVLSLLSFVPVLALAIVFVLTCGWPMFMRIVPMALFIGYLTAVHMVFVGSVRYRLPVEPFLIVFAGLTMAKLFDYGARKFGMRTAQ